MKKYSELVKKSILAAGLIGLGDYVLLKIGEPIGPVLFSLGLMAVCVLGANLFTGKCGFIVEGKTTWKELGIILVGNLVAGYLVGLMFSFMDGGVAEVAVAKVMTWEMSFSYFLKAVLCGVVMYVAVKMYKKGSVWGVLLGVPLFLFCGFQHSIANVITLGVARGFNFVFIGFCVVGNFIGSIITSYLLKK